MGLFHLNIAQRSSESYPFAEMHCHILPGIDDGSRTMNETLAMLRIAESQGITHMIVTPHYKEGSHNADPDRILDLIDEAQELAERENINIRLFPGNEIYFFEDIDSALEEEAIWSLNGTDQVLIEFSPTDTYNHIRNAVIKVQGAGYTPVIAHIERYECIVSDRTLAHELSEMGAGIQVNVSSITGALGGRIRSFCLSLIGERIVTYLGTDAHRSEGNRTPKVQNCLKYLYRKYDENYIRAISYENTMRIIEAE